MSDNLKDDFYYEVNGELNSAKKKLSLDDYLDLLEELQTMIEKRIEVGEKESEG